MNNKIATYLSRSLRGSGRRLLSLGLVLAAVGMLVFGALPNMSLASSHREAPFTAGDLEADNTDVYAFVSPDLTNTVTLIANYVPFQVPQGGPNFYPFGDDVLYEIKIDNTGNGEADVTYQFDFNSEVAQADATWIYNDNQITSINDPHFLHKQYYDVRRIENGTTTVVATHKLMPPDNIGPRSTPNYETLAMQAVYTTTNGGKVFAGQRDDPFYVDLGSIFDLAGLRPFNSLHLIPMSDTVGVDGLSGYNVNTIALQVPITDLTNNHVAVSGPTAGNAVVGVWATASRPSTRVLLKDGNHPETGQYVQVSRLGNPLINEVITPYGDKDYWNASNPADDKYFLKNYEQPVLTAYENLLYPALDDANTTGRADLVLILLNGVPGVNYTGTTKADMLRLNMGIPVTAAANRGNLGPLDANHPDAQGFPNGRRLTDDVVDIELRATAEGYGTFLATNFGLPNRSPNNLIGDGVNANDKPFKTTFPYVASPWQGYEATPPTP